MKQALLACGVLLAVVLGPALAAASGAVWGPDGVKPGPQEENPPEPPAPSATDASRLAEAEAALAAGEYDKALAAASALLRATTDAVTKTEAMRLSAEALRKKGDWRNAAPAYLRLRDRYQKDSYEFVRADAIAEVLRGSPTGVYPPLKSKAPAGEEAGDPKTLADDAVLQAALACLADQRSLRLKGRTRLMASGRTPKDVVSQFEPLVTGYSEARLLAPGRSAEDEREAAVAANKRLAAQAQAAVTQLRSEIEKYRPKMDRPWSFTNVEKKEIADRNAALRELAAIEGQFQKLLAKVDSTGWAEGETVRQESTDRANNYTHLAEEFVVPPYTVDYIW